MNIDDITDGALEVYAHFHVDGARDVAKWRSFCNASQFAVDAGLINDHGERLTDDATRHPSTENRG